ncbi:MAG: FKBP-type peptidyl-prolyl cis-trans isomerase [Bdellovibrionales bacterium]|nr:FKBP-type peptidyl-prolyl cis-trans isomerase [Bdellovibrionales bacterium]
MKKHLLVAALALTAFSCNQESTNVDLSSDKAKVSYAIGQQIGHQLKSENVDVDTKALSASIQDVIAGKESRISMDEMRAAMQKMQEGQSQKSSAEGVANKEAGDKFLAANKSKTGVKTTASGLQYEVMTEGKGKSPKATDTVKVHYKGTLLDGKTFDSSYDRGEPVEFPLNGVIRGWTEGLQLMKVGGKTRFFIPADLAYGVQGRPGIPPNSLLTFEVELLDIKKTGK